MTQCYACEGDTTPEGPNRRCQTCGLLEVAIYPDHPGAVLVTEREVP